MTSPTHTDLHMLLQFDKKRIYLIVDVSIVLTRYKQDQVEMWA